ncbi:MAG: membrane integrity-associated transporter subunit PqiC [Deltaproteobacteria bacterium]|nr:MAG: membrane integrity-associated transporter subunit PqiC [Deltaproteobacteria bacterium]
MMTKYVLQIAAIVVAAIAMGLGGCASISPPANFYVLSSITESGTSPAPVGNESKIAIGVGPVNIPDYLDRSQIVTRSSPNELKVAAFDRWAESLKSSFPRVLTENLSALLNTNQVAVFPWRKAIGIEYQVIVDVVRFDATIGGNAVLVARWRILGNGGNKLYVIKKSTFTVSTNTDDYAELVSAQSQTLTDFSREIAEAIKAISQ